MQINLTIDKDIESLSKLLSISFDLEDKFVCETDIQEKVLLETTLKESLKYIYECINNILADILLYKVNNKEIISRIGKTLLVEHFTAKRQANEVELKLQSNTCYQLYVLLTHLLQLDKDYVRIFLSVL